MAMKNSESVHLTLRLPLELVKEIEVQMAILGYSKRSEYFKACIEEKIARDNYQRESGTTYAVGEETPNYGAHPTRFDTELIRALVSNKNIQTIICDIVEKRTKRDKE